MIARDRDLGENPPTPPSTKSVRPRPAPVVAIIGGADPGPAAALLKALPASSELAFLYFAPQSVASPEKLASAFSKGSALPAAPASANDAPVPGSVRVIPPGTLPLLKDGVLQLHPEGPGARNAGAVDRFLSSLAAHAGDCAVAILLSESGSDGLEGLRAIRAAGGVAIVRDPSTGADGDLASRAVAAGLADRSLKPEEIGKELLVLAPRLCGPASEAPSGLRKVLPPEALRPILRKLLERTGVDFGGYKPGTIQRRVARRMALLGLRDPEEFLRYLEAQPAELEELFEDLLIHVTTFFRDPESHDVIAKRIIPDLLKPKRAGESVRVWVPGCSTGEEVYSTAILLLEALEKTRSVHPIQIFASDISERALARAREGFYPESIRQAVSEDRLRKYFTKEDGGFRITKRLRDLCIFVRHDLTRNPSFSRLDLVSCRNLLIYFEEDLQKRAIEIFHFALRPGGYLHLGESETVDGMAQRFERVTNTGRIFVRKSGEAALGTGFSLPNLPKSAVPGSPAGLLPARAAAADVERHAADVLLSRYVPATFLVNDRLDVLHLWGRTSEFIEHGPGKPELNLLRMLRSDLRADVRLAIHQAVQEGRGTRREKIRREGKSARGSASVEVEPLPQLEGAAERFFVVLLRQVSAPPAGTRAKSKPSRSAAAFEAEIERLRGDLASTVEYSQSFVKGYEAVNANLSAANEEIISTNEELQSTNEELETAKEELEAANEELLVQNQDLARLNADLTNLLSSSETAVVMLDAGHHIRRMTARAQDLLGLLPSDQGRSIEDLRAPFTGINLIELLTEVVRSAAPLVREVKAHDGRWYALQVRPYRVATGEVDGAVLSLHDIDAIKRREEEREQARRVLEESEQRFRRVADRAPVLIWMSGADALRTYFNTPWLEFRGRSMEQELGNGWAGGVHPQDYDRCLKTYQDSFQAREPFEMEYRLRRADGAYRWIIDRGVPLQLSDRTFVGFIGSCLDVTERKEAEEARARLAAIVEFSDDAIISKSLDGIVTSWNKAAENLFGYRASEILGKPITLIIPEERLDEERHILNRVVRGEQIEHLETIRKRKDGCALDVSLTVSPVRDSTGRVVGISKISRDITEQKRAQLAAARLAAIVESSEDAIVSKTLDGIVTTWNKGAERLFGYPAAEIVGKSITLLIPQERLSEEATILSKVSRGEPVEHFDTERRRKDGSLVDVSLSVSPVRDPSGRIVGASKVARDITERKNAEEAVRAANEGLEARVRERTAELEAFSYTIAHDLRAPLRAVHRFSDLLLEDYTDRPLDAEGRNYLKRMAEGVARMDRLIEDLLDYSRVARADMHLAPLDVEDILTEIRTDLAGELKEKKATFSVQDSLPPVLGDRVFLKQALVNLVSNALKFVDPGRSPQVRVSAEADGAFVRLMVRDNGIGIDPKYRDRIFKIFERLNASDLYPGTGVGLAIVKKAVERMKGHIGLNSELGQGSCFWIELARAQ
ncbi:MAG TPA: PAS domain S-box protein [Planctomycetota bacterium]|nr:PAS domain S-box protein [Planctomycetota bacterium]